LIGPFVALAFVLVSIGLRPAGTTSGPYGPWAGPLSAIVFGGLLLFAGATGLMFDDVLIAAVLATACWFGVELAWRRAAWLGSRRRAWLSATALFLIGVLLDLAVSPSGTAFCLVLLAVWFALTATDRLEAAAGWLLSIVLAIMSLASLDAVAEGRGGILTRAGGGVARALALGGFLTTIGLLRIRRASGGERSERLGDVGIERRTPRDRHVVDRDRVGHLTDHGEVATEDVWPAPTVDPREGQQPEHRGTRR
jgi:hypothetical protein